MLFEGINNKMNQYFEELRINFNLNFNCKVMIDSVFIV